MTFIDQRLDLILRNCFNGSIMLFSNIVGCHEKEPAIYQNNRIEII